MLYSELIVVLTDEYSVLSIEYFPPSMYMMLSLMLMEYSHYK